MVYSITIGLSIYLIIGTICAIKEMLISDMFLDTIFQYIFKMLFYVLLIILWPMWVWYEILYEKSKRNS